MRHSQHFVFLTLSNYSFLAVSSAVEALRLANQGLGCEVYRWTVASLDGAPVRASNGLVLEPAVPIGEVQLMNVVFVCGDEGIAQEVTPEVVSALRRIALHTDAMGALCSGVYALAKAGLLDQYKAVVHWEHLGVMQAQFPRVNLSRQIFAIDRDRYSCAGGAAPLEMVSQIIKQKLGCDLSKYFSEHFALGRIRSDQDHQRLPLHVQLGGKHHSLREATALMEANMEEPISIDDIAKRIGVTRRQIQRLFKRYVGETPIQFYCDLRLRWARSLLLQSATPIASIGRAAGFASPPHFSKQYRRLFGRTPRDERVLLKHTNLRISSERSSAHVQSTSSFANAALPPLLDIPASASGSPLERSGSN